MRNLIFLISVFCVSSCKCQVPIQLFNKSLHSGLTNRIGNFSIELLFHTTQSQPKAENLIVSPITVWTVLAVIAEGATDNTLMEISSAIRVHPKNKDKVKQKYQSLLRWLEVITPTIELQKFNALFVDDRNRPIKDFQDVAKGYDTRMISVNFADSDRTSQLVNTVINTVTHGRIPTLVSSADLENASLLLASALYFKGQWTVPFKKSSTTKQPFYDSDGVKLGEVNMMHNRYTYPFATIDKLQAQVLEMPYGEQNRLSMLIMLPNKGVSLKEMFYNLGSISLDTVFDKLKISVEDYGENEVECFLPRFKIESSLSLIQPLNKMGIHDLFDTQRARLPLMTNIPVFVSNIIHKAEIEVTEEGTTASAATAAEFGDRMGGNRFKANRPFCYMIIEKVTNTIAFGGFYQNPSLY